MGWQQIKNALLIYLLYRATNGQVLVHKLLERLRALNKRALIAVIILGAIVGIKLIQSIFINNRDFKRSFLKFIEKYLEEPKSQSDEEEEIKEQIIVEDSGIRRRISNQSQSYEENDEEEEEEESDYRQQTSDEIKQGVLSDVSKSSQEGQGSVFGNYQYQRQKKTQYVSRVQANQLRQQLTRKKFINKNSKQLSEQNGQGDVQIGMQIGQPYNSPTKHSASMNQLKSGSNQRSSSHKGDKKLKRVDPMKKQVLHQQANQYVKQRRSSSVFIKDYNYRPFELEIIDEEQSETEPTKVQ